MHCRAIKSPVSCAVKFSVDGDPPHSYLLLLGCVKVLCPSRCLHVLGGHLWTRVKCSTCWLGSLEVVHGCPSGVCSRRQMKHDGCCWLPSVYIQSCSYCCSDGCTSWSGQSAHYIVRVVAEDIVFAVAKPCYRQ